MMHERPPYPGVTREGLDFLRQLRENNEREWFKPRKHILEDEVIEPLRCLIDDFSRRAAERNLPLSGDPKRSIFRIYRDVRFSSDKRPYKTHVGLFLTRNADKNEPGGVYLHLEPDESFLGAGYWHPESKFLRRWRTALAAEPEAWFDVVSSLDRRGLTVDEGEMLKRMPRGFQEHAGTELDPWLRRKSFVTSRRLPDEALLTPALTENVLEFAADTLPLLEYGWRIQE